MSVALETSDDYGYNGEAEYEIDYGCDVVNVDDATEAPTEEAFPIPTVSFDEGEIALGEGEEYCEVICTAENTPNDLYCPVNDCNWVINELTGEYECVPRDCEWVFHQDSCTWECIRDEVIPVPPSEGGNGNGEVCDFTCEDIQGL